MQRLKAILAMATVFASLFACSDSDPDVRSDAAQPRPDDTVVAEVGSGDRAYVLETTNDFVSVADQAALVTVIAIERDPQITEVHNDELLQNRLIRATVDEPIKALTAGEPITFADGVYSRTRSSPDVEYGEEQLFVLTEGAELAVGSQALIGLRNGELMTDAVLLANEGVLRESERAGQFFDQTEGKRVADVVGEMRRIAAEPGG